MRRLGAAVLLGVVLGVAVTACGASDNGGTIQGPPATSTTSSTTTSTLPGGG